MKGSQDFTLYQSECFSTSLPTCVVTLNFETLDYVMALVYVLQIDQGHLKSDMFLTNDFEDKNTVLTLEGVTIDPSLVSVHQGVEFPNTRSLSV